MKNTETYSGGGLLDKINSWVRGISLGREIILRKYILWNLNTLEEGVCICVYRGKYLEREKTQQTKNSPYENGLEEK